MAVEDKYADTLLDSNGSLINQTNPAFHTGGLSVKAVYNTIEIAAANDANSVYRMFRDVPASIIPLFLAIGGDAALDITDFNVGLWKPNYGAVVIENCLADALNPSSGNALSFAGALDGLAALALESRAKQLYEIANHTLYTKLGAYDIGFKSITDPGEAGTLSAMLLFAHS